MSGRATTKAKRAQRHAVEGAMCTKRERLADYNAFCSLQVSMAPSLRLMIYLSSGRLHEMRVDD